MIRGWVLDEPFILKLICNTDNGNALEHKVTWEIPIKNHSLWKNIQSWPKISALLVNMIKEGFEN